MTPDKKLHKFLTKQRTEEDAHGTLMHNDLGLPTLDKPTFTSLLNKAKTINLPAKHIAKLKNTSVVPKIVNKGINDSSIINGLGLGDQRHNSWESILHHANSHEIEPAIAIHHNGKLTLLDGDHRAVAAALTNRHLPIKVINAQHLA